MAPAKRCNHITVPSDKPLSRRTRRRLAWKDPKNRRSEAVGPRSPLSRVRLAHRRQPDSFLFLRFFGSSNLRRSRQPVQRDGEASVLGTLGSKVAGGL